MTSEGSLVGRELHLLSCNVSPFILSRVQAKYNGPNERYIVSHLTYMVIQVPTIRRGTNGDIMSAALFCGSKLWLIAS
jgi:hypothetical protein